MLEQTTDFPYAGSTAFLRGTAQQARIIRYNADETCLISIPDHRFPAERASGNRTVPLADLYPTREAAIFCGTTRRRGAR